MNVSFGDPALNALLNGVSALLLAGGYWAIRHRRIAMHRLCMLTAFCVSAVFLAGYLWYHSRVGTVYFHGPNWLRAIYLAILIPHSVFAGAVVPLAIVTLTFALRQRWGSHRRLARWVLPIWLFVSVSGIAVYYLLFGWGREARY